MSWVAAAVIGSTVVGGLLQSDATQNAANTQANATRASQDQLLQSGANAAKLYDPYIATGQTGLNNLNQLNNSGYLTRQFNNQDLQSNLSPNYQFMLGQGQQANIQASNVGGGGSNVNRANQIFSQNYASNAYQNAFNNFQAQRTNIYNQSKGLSEIGLTGAQGSANAQIGTGTNIASLTAGLGNAQAASQIAQGNILGGAANTIGGAAAYSLMNQGGGGGASLASLGSQNWNAPSIGGAPTGGYTNMGGGGYGIGGFVPA